MFVKFLQTGKYGHETELIFRGGECLVARVINSPYQRNAELTPNSKDFSLSVDPGNLDSFHYRQLRTPKLRDNEVLARVLNVGFNFKDLLIALNAISELDQYLDRKCQLGQEFCGVVEVVGSSVTHLKVGDTIIAMLPQGGAFANKVVCNALDAVCKPKTLDVATAAGVPIVFATAYYALVSLGNLRKGGVALIHSAAGGVGQAAVQIARIILNSFFFFLLENIFLT